jgi:hypothetical protein
MRTFRGTAAGKRRIESAARQRAVSALPGDRHAWDWKHRVPSAWRMTSLQESTDSTKVCRLDGRLQVCDEMPERPAAPRDDAPSARSSVPPPAGREECSRTPDDQRVTKGSGQAEDGGG